jgi:hypothetical protein
VRRGRWSAREKVDAILAGHGPAALPPGASGKLDGILATAQAELPES